MGIAWPACIEGNQLVNIFLKTTPQRSQVLVVGGGVAGICAAISAARQGSLVNLIEARQTIGGRIGEEIRIPFDLPGGCNSAFPRESGLLDEICHQLLAHNTEGTHAGQGRVLFSLLDNEPRVQVFTGVRVLEANLNSKGDKIEACLGICQSTGRRFLFKSEYFIDCSGSGNLSQLVGAPGEEGIDLGEEGSADSNPQMQRTVALVQIVKREKAVRFTCPSWVKIKWEENQLEPRLEWLESLNRSLLGYHHIEWVSSPCSRSPSSEEIAWAAWDFLKNRSLIQNASADLAIERISPIQLSKSGFRGHGDYQVCKEDFIEGKRFHDAVAVGRSPLQGAAPLLCSNRGKFALPQPFEIPLRALYSKKIRNLFWAGEHASVSFEASLNLGHTPTAAQLAIATGHCAAHCIQKKRLPRTLAKKGHIEDLRKSLELCNHRTGLTSLEDELNLSTLAKVTASSTWEEKNIRQLECKTGIKTDACLIQFPIQDAFIDGINITLSCENPLPLDARLLAGTLYDSNLPGDCLDACSYEVKEAGVHKISLDLKTSQKCTGWHFLEISSEVFFSVIEVKNPPVGLKVSYPQEVTSSGASNSFSNYQHRTPSDYPILLGPLLEISTQDRPYSAQNVLNHHHRPSNLPNLWVSKPSDFKYPEFLELIWPEEVEISKISIHFDGTYDLLFPPHPLPGLPRPLPSLVKDYRIYTLSPCGKSKLLIEIKDNFLSFREHDFDPIRLQGVEVEILKTHGFDRAQIYRVSTY